MEATDKEKSDDLESSLGKIGALRFLIAALVFLFHSSALGAEEFLINDGRFHVYADRTIYHVKEKVYEAFGNVVMSAKDRRISANYAWIDGTSFEAKLRGDVVYATRQAIIYAQEMHLKLNDGSGSIFNGRVVSDQYLLKGQLIRKISDDQFLVTRGEYSTCKDCPESWKFVAKSIDLTIEGYAFMSDVYIHLKELPFFYFPYLVVPVKTKRQTGFLFPRFSFDAGDRSGLTYSQPFFWAINDNQDLTVTYKEYFAEDQGWSSQLEHNYRYYWGIQGQTLFNYFADQQQIVNEENAKQNKESVLEDRDSIGFDRYAIYSEHLFPLSEKFDVRLLLRETRENRYVLEFPEQVYAKNPGKKTLPAIESNVTAQSKWDDFYIAFQAKRYRNIAYDSVRSLDPGTVNVFPSLFAGITEKPLFLGMTGSVAARYDNFFRKKKSFEDEDGDGRFDAQLDESDEVDNKNPDFVGQPEYIREAQRFIFEPTVALPISLGNAWNVSPSLQFTRIAYLFNIKPVVQGEEEVDNTVRDFLTARINASTVIEKVWDFDESVEDYSRMKHQVSPYVEYVTVPYKREDQNHVFTRQTKVEGGKFDSFDVIPISVDDDILKRPIGNTLVYGFYSRLILKDRKEEEKVKAFPYDLERLQPNKYGNPASRLQELNLRKNVLKDMYAPDYGGYAQIWRLSLENSLNIEEWSRNVEPNTSVPDPNPKSDKEIPNKRRPFGNLEIRSDFGFSNFTNGIAYKLIPYQGEKRNKEKHEVNVGLGYSLLSLTNRRGTLSVNRSFGINYSYQSTPSPARSLGLRFIWSFNDYLTFNGGLNRDLLNKDTRSWTASFLYNAPSECWNIKLGVNWDRNRAAETKKEIVFDLGVNLLGTGYIGARSAAANIPGGGF